MSGYALGMPSVEPDDPPSTPDRPFLKSHKALPRRREVDPEVEVIRIYHSTQDEHSSNATTVATAPALPLTPPGAAQDDTTGDELETPKLGSCRSNQPTIAVTPHNTHPPTPENTPPRVTPTNRQGLTPFGNSVSSSRAESFRTAREMISDGETETPGRSPEILQPRQYTNVPRSRSLRRNGSSSGSPKVRDRESHDARKARDAFPREKRRFLKGDDQARQSAISAQKRKPSQDPSEKFREPGTDVRKSKTSPSRQGSLRRGKTKEPVPSLSLEQFREEIGWPSKENQFEPVERPGSHRSSGVSTSTIEARIVDSPRSSKRTLRHTEKRGSLRSTSSPITKSERTSVASESDSQRRLVHKAVRITDNDRLSMCSDKSTFTSATPSTLQSNVEVVPVVVIPERRSSLKSSASTSRNHLTRSQRSSRRGRNESGSRANSDISRSEKQLAFNLPQEPELRGRGFGPVIPPRSSSLSAPTSRNNSRATSLTSESLRNHNLAMDLDKQKLQTDHPPPVASETLGRDTYNPRDARNVQSILIGVEDMANLRPPSLPFTATSIQSISPGPIEINEAITVSFFPHNNKSLLLIDQTIQPPQAMQRLKPDLQIKAENPQTPEIPLPTPPTVDSPLRNPRPPPKPPVSNLSQSVNAEDSTRDQEPTKSRRFGSVRHAWSVRPRSESFNSIKRTFSTTSAKNRTAGKDMDARLHPFWRPRRFWNDSPESEQPSPKEETKADTEPFINNSLGMPQQKVIFSGPPITRRPGPGPAEPNPTNQNTGLTIHSNLSRANLVGSRVFSPDFFHASPMNHSQHHFHSLSRWGYRFRFVRIRNLRKSVRRSLQRRREGKREAKRQKLKSSIVVMGSGTLNRSTMRPLE